MRFLSPLAVRGVLFVGAIALAVPLPADAQERGTVRGTVVEGATRRAVPGVQVYIPNTGIGTLTNAGGQYVLLNVPIGQTTVRAQIIGYRTEEQTVTVTAGQTATANFSVAQSAIALDEVVVTGAGVATQKKKLGNTVATLNASSLANAPVRNVSEMLSAREPGVVALPTGGLAGEGARIRIRGHASLTQLLQPVVYVDGVRVDRTGGVAPGNYAGGGGEPSRLDDINPASIERVEILKGAAAATLYGTEASSGVIQIFTKAGSAGAPRYDLQIEQGFSEYPEDAYAPTAGFARTATQADYLRQHWGLSTLQPFEVFEVDIIPQMFETGKYTNTSLSVSGGSPLITYFVSGRYADENGPFGGQQLCQANFPCTTDTDEKKQANANITIFPLDKMRVRVNSMYTEANQAIPHVNNYIYGSISSAIMAKPELADCNASQLVAPMTCESAGDIWGAPAFITTEESMHRITSEEIQRFAGSAGVAYELLGVSLDATFGIDIVNQRGTFYLPFGYNTDNYTANFPNGYRFISDRNNRELTGEFKGSYQFRPSDTWSFHTTLGTQAYFSTAKNGGGDGFNFPGPGIEVVGGGSTQTSFESFQSTAQLGLFAQEQIGFREYAFLTVGARYDKHSAFGESSEGVLYPKVSLSIVPTDMPGWSMDKFSTLRLRAAIGQSGRQPGAFDKFTTFSALASSVGAGLAPAQLGNPDIKPEISTEREFGIDLGVLNNRLSLELTRWDRTVKDVLVAKQFPPSGGFRAQQLANIGELEASGWEVGARGVAFASPSISLNLMASAAYLKETIVDMGGAAPLKSGGSYTRYRNYYREGAAPLAFYGPKLREVGANEFPFDLNGDCQPDTRDVAIAALGTAVNPSSIPVLLEGGDPRQACASGDYLAHYLGKPVPDWSGTFGGTLSLFGKFELATNFEFKAGNFQVHDLTGAFRRANPLIGRNIREAAEVEATLLNPASTAEQRLAAADKWARELAALSPYDGLNEVFDADFIRWREVSLTYFAPEALTTIIGAKSVAFTVGGRNLVLWTKYPGADPELNAVGLARSGAGDNNLLEGTNAFGVPIPRRVSLSTRITF